MTTATFWAHVGHYWLAVLLFRAAVMEIRRSNRVADWFAAACFAAGIATLAWYP